jgi:hypothetical protein
MLTTNDFILKITSFFLLLFFKSIPVPVLARVYHDQFDHFYHPYLGDFDK